MSKANIVLIHCRELGRFIEPYGYKTVPTPNLQRLADSGILFTNAICNALSSSPVGAVLFTGQSAHEAGMLGPSAFYTLKHPARHLAGRLREAGYSTATVGFQHFKEEPTKLGYEEKLAAGDESAGAVAEAVTEFLERKPSQPFFLSVGFREKGMDMPWLSDGDSNRVESDPNHRAAAAAIDEALGRVASATKKARGSGPVVVICTTDHGNVSPIYEPNLEDTGIGVLLLMHGLPDSIGPRRICAFVSHLDIYPTVCSLAGLEPPGRCDGESLLPLLQSDPQVRDRTVFVETNILERRHVCRVARTAGWSYAVDFEKIWVKPGGVVFRSSSTPHPYSPPRPAGANVFAPPGTFAPTTPPASPAFALGEILTAIQTTTPGANGGDATARKKLSAELKKWMKSTNDPALKKTGIQGPPGVGATPMEPTRRWVVSARDRVEGWFPLSWWNRFPHRFNRPIDSLGDLINWINWAWDAPRRANTPSLREYGAVQMTWSLLRELGKSIDLRSAPTEPTPSWAGEAGDEYQCIERAEFEHAMSALRDWCREQMTPPRASDKTQQAKPDEAPEDLPAAAAVDEAEKPHLHVDKPLIGRAKKAAHIITKQPGLLGKDIAHQMGIGQATFRRLMMKELKPRGFTNACDGTGYYPPE